MANPFTSFINRSHPESAFAQFIVAWDEAEELLIAVYREGKASPADEKLWIKLQKSINGLFPDVRDILHTQSVNTTSGNNLDAIQMVLAMPTIKHMPGNKPILKLLPDIREMINRSLLDQQ